jgi:hypothetical protein
VQIQLRPVRAYLHTHCALLTICHSDWLVGNATQQSSVIPTANLTNGTTFSGQTTYDGYVYQTSVQYVSGYLPDTSVGINHNLTVGSSTVNASDGFVALMNVKILTSPPGATSKKSSCVFLFPSREAYRLTYGRSFAPSFTSEQRHPRGPRPFSPPSLHSSPCSLLHYSYLNNSGPPFCLEGSHGHARTSLNYSRSRLYLLYVVLYGHFV